MLAITKREPGERQERRDGSGPDHDMQHVCDGRRMSTVKSLRGGVLSSHLLETSRHGSLVSLLSLVARQVFAFHPSSRLSFFFPLLPSTPHRLHYGRVDPGHAGGH
jgi:hypothetical protein